MYLKSLQLKDSRMGVYEDKVIRYIGELIYDLPVSKDGDAVSIKRFNYLKRVIFLDETRKYKDEDKYMSNQQFWSETVCSVARNEQSFWTCIDILYNATLVIRSRERESERDVLATRLGELSESLIHTIIQKNFTYGELVYLINVFQNLLLSISERTKFKGGPNDYEKINEIKHHLVAHAHDRNAIHNILQTIHTLVTDYSGDNNCYNKIKMKLIEIFNKATISISQ